MINSQTVPTNAATDLRVIRPPDQFRPQVAFDYAHAWLALYVFFLGICVALVLLLPFFPSQDGPNHLYNLVILRDLLHGGKGWAHFYVPNVRFTPNLGFELFTYPLLSVLAPIRAEHVFLCFYIVLLGLAVPVFLKSFDVPSLPLSFFVFVALFNRAFLMGFFGYAIGIPVLLLALSGVWRVRHSSLKTQFLLLNALGAALFAIHVVVFAIFLLAVGLTTVTAEYSWASRFRRAGQVLVILSPCLLLLGSYLVPQFYKVAMLTTSAGRATATTRLAHHFMSPLVVLDLLSLSGLSFSWWHLLPGMAAMVFFLAAAISFCRHAMRGLRAELHWHCRFLGSLCCALLLLYFLMPDAMLGGGDFKLRLPWVIMLFALPLLWFALPSLSKERYSALLILIATAGVATNVFLLRAQSHKVEGFVVATSEAPLPPRATVLTANFDAQNDKLFSERWVPDALLHAASYYGLQGAVDLGGFSSTSDLPYMLVHYRKRLPTGVPFTVYTQPQTVDWASVTQPQFLLCWKAGNQDFSRLSRYFILAWKKPDKSLTIWKRRQPEQVR